MDVHSTIMQEAVSEEKSEDFSSPYSLCAPKRRNDISPTVIMDHHEKITAACEKTLADAHMLLSPQVDEIFVVLASDTDRISRPGVPAHVPVAYSLKGGGMSTNTLRAMMDDIKNAMVENKMNIVYEVFDGYHHAYMERDANNEPLYST